MKSFGLGIDAGGTQTRWALAATGEIVAEGIAEGLTGLLMGSVEGRERITKTLGEIARAVAAHGRPRKIVAGMTGIDLTRDDVATLIGAPFAPAEVTLRNDVEIAYLDVFAPGEGYLVYAGTGSIGLFIDEGEVTHRVGGYGGIVDDAGSGFWIAVQALRHVWRAHDEAQPTSLLAAELFAAIGGDVWDTSRSFVYGASFAESRGKIGRLALAVAKAAEGGDADAERILSLAGGELARLANIFTRRFGVRPIALAGRVVELHPLVERSMRAALPGAMLEVRVAAAHQAAARIASR